MYRFEPGEEILEFILLGQVVKVERFGSPIKVLILTYADGRSVNLAASDDDLIIGEENLPEC